MYTVCTLNQNKDFKRLYFKGKSFVSPVVVVYVMKNKSNNIRYGITTSKKVGKACKRNRAKRVINVAFYSLLPDISNGYDFVFVARAKTPFVKSDYVLRCMSKQLKQAGVLL